MVEPNTQKHRDMKNYVFKNSYPVRARDRNKDYPTPQADQPFLNYGLLRTSTFVHRTSLRISVFALRAFTSIKQFWSNFLTGFFEEERFRPEPRCYATCDLSIESNVVRSTNRELFNMPPKEVPPPQPAPPLPPPPEIRPLNPMATGRATMEVKMFPEDYTPPPRHVLPPDEKPKPYTVEDFKRDARNIALGLGFIQVGEIYLSPGYHLLLTYDEGLSTGMAGPTTLLFKFEDGKLFFRQEHGEKVTDVETQYEQLPEDNWENLLKYLVEYFGTPTNFTGVPCFVESEFLSEIDFYRISSQVEIQ